MFVCCLGTTALGFVLVIVLLWTVLTEKIEAPIRMFWTIYCAVTSIVLLFLALVHLVHRVQRVQQGNAHNVQEIELDLETE
jgi:hypothetical protein